MANQRDGTAPPLRTVVMIVHAVVVVVISIKIKTVNQMEMSMAPVEAKTFPDQLRFAQAVPGSRAIR
jgi:hypothetical protein